MGRYLLDSNAFIWAKIAPNVLASQAREIIEDSKNTLFVSAACLWELADKASKGKLPEFELILRQQPDGLIGSLQQSGMQLMPIEVTHIETAYRLPLLHRDPFDRMMIAQALTEDAIVISRDRIFRDYPRVKLVPA